MAGLSGDRRRAGRLCVLASVVALGLGVSACAPDLGPAPTLKPMSAFASAKSFAAPVRDWPGDAWWTAYGDLQLNALEEEALAGAPDLRAAEARIRQALALVEQNRAANLPQLSFNGSVQTSRSSLNEGQPAFIQQYLPYGYHTQSRLTFDLAWQLDFFGRNRAALASATSAARAAEADLAAARLQLSTAVATAYADLARLYAERDAASESVRVREATLTLVSDRLRNGLETRGQYSQQASTIPQARQEVEALDRQIATTRNQLSALLAAGPDRGLAVARPTAQRIADFGLPSTLGADLVGRRPDLAAARLRAEAAASRVKVAKADFYPNVNLNGAYGVQSLGIDVLLQKNSIVGALGPALSLPIFSRGRLEGLYRGARAEYDEAVASYDNTLAQALRDVADAVAGVKSAGAQLVEARAALASGEDAYRIAQLRYRGGLSTYLDVLTAESAVLAQRRTVADLGAQALSLDVALVRALGGGYISSR